MKWNHYLAAALFTSLVFLAAGAPPIAVLAGITAVALFNVFHTGRARR